MQLAKQNVIKAAFILTFCGVFCRILGAFYRVPQANMLGSEGMGNYYLIFPIFSFMISLSASSIPQSLSKLVAESVQNGEQNKAKKYFKSSLLLMTFFGLFCSLLMIFFAPFLSKLQQNTQSLNSYFAIAPAVFFVCLISCFRGYFQGYQTMTFSGISQIIEQVIKVAFGLYLTSKLLVYGIEYGVFGSLIAITISEFIALVYLFISYKFFAKKIVNNSGNTISYKQCFKDVIKTTMPFTLSYVIFPLSVFLDSLFVVKFLTISGLSGDFAMGVFGLNGGVINTLTNLPIVVSTALAVVVVPSLSGDIKSGNREGCNEKIALIFKICVLIILPCVIVFAIFPKEIIMILFGSLASGVIDELAIASNMLIISSIGVLYLGIFQVSSGILQSSGDFYIPVKSLGIGVAVRLVLCVVLCFVPKVNIYAISIANVVCFFIIATFNVSALQKSFNVKINYKSALIFPIISCVCMVVAVIEAKLIFVKIFSESLAAFISLFVGGAVYLCCLILFKVFGKSELRAMING